MRCDNANAHAKCAHWILKELWENYSYSFVMKTLKLAVSRIRIYTWAFNRIDTVFRRWFCLASKPSNYTHAYALVNKKKKTREIPDKITEMPLNTPETEKSAALCESKRDSICARVWIDYYYCVFPYCHRNLQCERRQFDVYYYSVVCSARSNLHEFT